MFGPKLKGSLYVFAGGSFCKGARFPIGVLGEGVQVGGGLVFLWRVRENQRTLKGGGGAKKRAGQNLTRRPPTENSFRPPSPRYVWPLPADLLRNSFRRVSKIVSDGPRRKL